MAQGVVVPVLSSDLINLILVKSVDYPCEYFNIARTLSMRFRYYHLPNTVVFDKIMFNQIGGDGIHYWKTYACSWLKNKNTHLTENEHGLVWFGSCQMENESLFVFLKRNDSYFKVQNNDHRRVVSLIYNSTKQIVTFGHTNGMFDFKETFARHLKRGMFVRCEWVDGTFQKIIRIDRTKTGMGERFKMYVRFKNPKYNNLFDNFVVFIRIIKR